MLPQESLEEQLGNILNRLNAVISEGKGLLNELNIQYDNLPAFDSVINAIKNYANYKPYQQRLQNTWFEPVFYKDGKEYYVNTDPVTELVEFGKGYLLTTTSGKVFHSMDCSTFHYICNVAANSVTPAEMSTVALPQWSIPGCPFAIILWANGTKLEVHKYTFEKDGGHQDQRFDDTIYALSLASIFSTDEGSGFILNVATSTTFYQYKFVYDPSGPDFSWDIILERTFSEGIQQHPFITKYNSVNKSDPYAFDTEQILFTNTNSVHISHKNGTDEAPCTFFAFTGNSIGTFIRDKIVVTPDKKILRVYAKNSDGVYERAHVITPVFQNKDENIVRLSKVSNDILAIITNKGIYLTDHVDSAYPKLLFDNMLKLPSTMEDFHRLLTTRKYICIIDTTAKCYMLRLPDGMANQNTLSIETESLSALDGRYIKGNIGSNLRGYSWLSTPDMSNEGYHIAEIGAFNSFDNAGLVYGNGIGIMYEPCNIKSGVSKKNIAYTLDGDHWMTPDSLRDDLEADWIVFMKNRFYAIRAIRGIINSAEPLDDTLHVYSTSHDMNDWIEHQVGISFHDNDTNGESMQQRLAHLVGAIGSDQGIFLLGKDITRCAALSPSLIVDYVDIGESEPNGVGVDIQPYGSFIKDRFFICGEIEGTPDKNRGIVLVGTMSWKPGETNKIFGWKRLLKVIITYGDGVHDPQNTTRLYTNGDSLLAVEYIWDVNSVNNYKVGAIYNCNINFGVLERRGYGETVEITLTQDDAMNLAWMKENNTGDFNLMSVCGTSYVLWGSTTAVSDDGYIWRSISDSIKFAPSTGKLSAGMLGNMGVMRYIQSDNHWKMLKSGDMKLRKTHVFTTASQFDKDGIFEYALEFTPKLAALFSIGDTVCAHLVSTERLISDIEEDLYSIIIDETGIIKNSETMDKMACIGPECVLFTSSFITAGKSYILIAF